MVKLSIEWCVSLTIILPFTVILYLEWYYALIKSLAKASHVKVPLKVIQHMNNRINVIEACRMTQKRAFTRIFAKPCGAK
jgi:hypothetical protein